MPTFSFDIAPLVGAAKYANKNGIDPGIGRFSTLLTEKIPPGYIDAQMKQISTERKVQISMRNLGIISIVYFFLENFNQKL